MSQTIILQSEEILVVDQDDPTGIFTTEVETILLVEDTEVVVLEVAEQGLQGLNGLNGLPGLDGLFAIRRVPYLPIVDGEQIVTLPTVPVPGLPINVFINGLLHADVLDYSSSSLILTLGAAMGIAANDHITIIYQ